MLERADEGRESQLECRSVTSGEVKSHPWIASSTPSRVEGTKLVGLGNFFRIEPASSSAMLQPFLSRTRDTVQLRATQRMMSCAPATAGAAWNQPEAREIKAVLGCQGPQAISSRDALPFSTRRSLSRQEAVGLVVGHGRLVKGTRTSNDLSVNLEPAAAWARLASRRRPDGA